jgi:hypothetical protein
MRRDRLFPLGKYLVVWRKDAGTWRAVQDIWNSDNPAAAPARK